mmetsp:Transcript_4942/g.16305  ORF Transcript_4942/g.16305 Transcript_4942/m.16305 type:complete len:399 (+) Transcript_4942:337-1533(+)
MRSATASRSACSSAEPCASTADSLSTIDARSFGSSAGGAPAGATTQGPTVRSSSSSSSVSVALSISRSSESKKALRASPCSGSLRAPRLMVSLSAGRSSSSGEGGAPVGIAGASRLVRYSLVSRASILVSSVWCLAMSAGAALPTVDSSRSEPCVRTTLISREGCGSRAPSPAPHASPSHSRNEASSVCMTVDPRAESTASARSASCRKLCSASTTFGSSRCCSNAGVSSACACFRWRRRNAGCRLVIACSTARPVSTGAEPSTGAVALPPLGAGAAEKGLSRKAYLIDASGQMDRAELSSVTHLSDSSGPSLPSAANNATRIKKLTSTSTMAADGRNSSSADTALLSAAAGLASGAAPGTGEGAAGASTPAAAGEGEGAAAVAASAAAGGAAAGVAL